MSLPHATSCCWNCEKPAACLHFSMEVVLVDITSWISRIRDKHALKICRWFMMSNTASVGRCLAIILENWDALKGIFRWGEGISDGTYLQIKVKEIYNYYQLNQQVKCWLRFKQICIKFCNCFSIYQYYRYFKTSYNAAKIQFLENVYWSPTYKLYCSYTRPIEYKPPSREATAWYTL